MIDTEGVDQRGNGSDRYFQSVMEMAGLGTWRFDVQTGLVLLDEGMRTICEETNKALPLNRILKRIYPEDRPHVTKKIRAALNPEPGTRFSMEYRIFLADQTLRWISVDGIARFREGEEELAGFFGTALDITQRKQAEKELIGLTAESERQKRLYETVLSATPDLVYVFDLNYRFTFANDALLKMWGKTSEESIGRSLLENGYEPWHAEMHEREIDQIIATKQPVRGEVSFPHATLGRRIYDYIIVPVMNDGGEVEAIAGTTRDITELKKSEIRNQFLLHLNDVVRQFADPDRIKMEAVRILGEYIGASRVFYAEVSADETVMSFDRDYVQDVSSMAGRYRLEEFGLPLVNDLRAGKTVTVPDVSDPIAKPPLPESEKELYRTFNIRAFAAVPLLKEKRFTAFLGIHQSRPHNWTKDEIKMMQETAERTWAAVERSRTKDALLSSEEKLRSVNATLEERVEERTAALLSYQKQLRILASELSKAEERERHRLATELHDNLGQTLAVGKMKLDLLKRDRHSESEAADLADLGNTIDESIRYTRKLMSDLKPPPSLEKEDLSSATDWLARQMKKHGLTVHITDDGEVKPLSEDVGLMLLQAMRELLFNVVKHSGVDRARVLLERHGDRVRISVEDEGKGFNMEGTKPPIEEGGFGLFHIQERLDLLGGGLEIISGPGKGTRAVLVAPVKYRDTSGLSDPADRESALEEPGPPVRRKTGSKVNVLLVDDHRMVRTGLRKIIEEEDDLKVIAEASNGREAVNMAGEIQPDVVVMDVDMPEMNGIEATRRILAKLPDVRIIGLSLHNKETVMQAMRGAGASAYLIKSEVYETLCATIRSEAFTRARGH